MSERESRESPESDRARPREARVERVRKRDGRVVPFQLAKIRDAVTSLTRELMTVQVNGDYAAAQALLKKLVELRDPVKAVLEKLKDVPVDIEPRFVSIR